MKSENEKRKRRRGGGYQHGLEVVEDLLVAVVGLVLGAAVDSLLHIAGEIKPADGEVHLRLAHPVPISDSAPQ